MILPPWLGAVVVFLALAVVGHGGRGGRSERRYAVVRNASPALHAVLALLVLLAAVVLAVYKPRGMTRYGWRKQHEQRAQP